MFSYLRNFVHRHRRKFLFAGIAFGGVTLLGKLAERKLLEWHNEQSRQLLEQQKKKQHYERTLNTVRVALLQLIPKMRKVLERELDTEALILAIKDQPQKKRELWNQLKIISFGRAVCTVVSVAVATPVSHVMMMVLAANTLEAAEIAAVPQGSSVSVEVQIRYLSCLQNLIEDQLPELVGKVMDMTSNALSSLPLTQKLTLSQLEAILQDICQNITNISEDTASPSILPWSQYLRQPEDIICPSEANEQFRQMYLLTVDILNTDDFNVVVNTLMQVGLNYVLDEMAGFYFSNHIASQKAACEALRKESSILSKPEDGDGVVLENSWHDAVKNTEKGESLSDDPNLITEDTSQQEPEQSLLQTANSGESSEGAHNDNETSSSSSSTNVELVSSLVVKLVPMLNSILHKALPDVHHMSAHMLPSEDNTLFGRLVLCSQLEALSFNVYDSLVLSGPAANTRG